MATFKMPLSGDVVQSINPWTAFFSPIGSQLGVININLGQSSDPDVEAEVLSDVGTYGKQIGRSLEAGSSDRSSFLDEIFCGCRQGWHVSRGKKWISVHI